MTKCLERNLANLMLTTLETIWIHIDRSCGLFSHPDSIFSSLLRASI